MTDRFRYRTKGLGINEPQWSSRLAGQCRAICLMGALVSGIALAPAARADPPLSVTANLSLEFGSFIVLTSGSKWVHASGLVVDQGVLPMPGSTQRPAQFTIRYRRGGGQAPADIVLLIAVARVSPITVGSVTATISAIDTDLPGVPALIPGQTITYTMPGCDASCSVSFRVGARLDITATSSGAKLVFPLVVTAQVVRGN